VLLQLPVGVARAEQRLSRAGHMAHVEACEGVAEARDDHLTDQRPQERRDDAALRRADFHRAHLRQGTAEAQMLVSGRCSDTGFFSTDARGAAEEDEDAGERRKRPRVGAEKARCIRRSGL
jgi:hypothetical protein